MNNIKQRHYSYCLKKSQRSLSIGFFFVKLEIYINFCKILFMTIQRGTHTTSVPEAKQLLSFFERNNIQYSCGIIQALNSMRRTTDRVIKVSGENERVHLQLVTNRYKQVFLVYEKDSSILMEKMKRDKKLEKYYSLKSWL